MSSASFTVTRRQIPVLQVQKISYLMRIFSTGLESGTQASTSENWEPAGGGLADTASSSAPAPSLSLLTSRCRILHTRLSLELFVKIYFAMAILNFKISSTITRKNIYRQSENILTDDSMTIDLAGGRSLQQTLWVMVSCASSCCSWVQAV